MNHVVEHFINEMIAVYGPAKSENPDAFYEAYTRILKKYTAHELDAAVDKVLKNNSYKSWPAIGECVAACEDARQSAAGHDQVFYGGYQSPDDRKKRYEREYDQASAWARDYLSTTVTGERALSEGWGRKLHGYLVSSALWRIREKQPLPEFGEIRIPKDTMDYFSKHCRVVDGERERAILLQDEALIKEQLSAAPGTFVDLKQMPTEAA